MKWLNWWWKKMPKVEKFIFELECIHEWLPKGYKEPITSHRIIRALTLQELVAYIKMNEIPTSIVDEQHDKITLFIRGVNF